MTQHHYEIQDRVAVLTLDNPPVNGLGHVLRQAIVAGVRQANDDPAVAAIILVGAGKAFSGGADIREFNTPKMTAEPNLSEVITAIERSAKPVIAAIHSVCMGGGLELALGCHYRVAAPGAQIALPEVKLGLLPGAGGTQRLPRLLGVETALQMIVSGDAAPSERFKDTALFDAMIEGELLPGAVAFACSVADRRPLPLVRTLKTQPPKDPSFFQMSRQSLAAASRNFPAPLKCLDAVAASVEKAFDDGLAVEYDCFSTLINTPESKALRHAFFAERAAAKIKDVPDITPVRSIAKVAVIGAGTMGAGIAMNFLNAGLPVTILETGQDALDRGVAAMRKNYEGSVKKGKLTPEKMEKTLALLSTSLRYDDIAAADLVIEAVFEDMGVKEQVFRQLDAVMKPGAILASNTSTLDVDKIAGFTGRPQDVVGLHFFSPANVMKLLEVVRGAATAKDVLATVMQLAKKIRKTAIISGVCDGFIGNRMIEHYSRQATFLLDAGAMPWQIDQALEKFGMAMGPFRMSDLAGNDISWKIRQRRYVEKPDLTYSKIPDLLCEKGRFGQKTGLGWYRYEPGKRDAIPDPEVERLIVDYRKANGLAARSISDAEIVERCIFALVNEGARILEDGIAARASDIDMVYLSGYGFPLYRGGPMLYADQIGLAKVAETLKGLAKATGDAFWQPAPLLARLAADGKSFNG